MDPTPPPSPSTIQPPPSFSRPKCRRVVVLGSTGSIGQSALKVAEDIPERMKIVGLAADRSVEALLCQILRWKPQAAALYDSAAAQMASDSLRSRESKPTPMLQGDAGLCELATLPEADLVLVAIVGTAGLRPTLAAIEAGKDVAIASKEILVMAGSVVMEAARRKGVQVLPVDSEHNAIFQCLENRSPSEVSRLILTASGGPFRTLPADQLSSVTPQQALKHPTWDMGRKISIDSATLFNKGLEMIEARWLFNVPMPQVQVIIHPQSIVHSMVEFVDSSVLAQLSATDMCFPIQYAVTWPERVQNRLPPLDFAQIARLDFEAPRIQDFPALDLARFAGEQGGTLPAVLNAANEIAVETFLQGGCFFPDIWRTVDAALHAHSSDPAPGLDSILEADQWARHFARKALA